jgi:hypothetical protein
MSRGQQTFKQSDVTKPVTTARLALTLFLYTGHRRGDVVRLGQNPNTSLQTTLITAYPQQLFPAN